MYKLLTTIKGVFAVKPLMPKFLHITWSTAIISCLLFQFTALAQSSSESWFNPRSTKQRKTLLEANRIPFAELAIGDLENLKGVSGKSSPEVVKLFTELIDMSNETELRLSGKDLGILIDIIKDMQRLVGFIKRTGVGTESVRGRFESVNINDIANTKVYLPPDLLEQPVRTIKTSRPATREEIYVMEKGAKKASESVPPGSYESASRKAKDKFLKERYGTFRFQDSTNGTKGGVTSDAVSSNASALRNMNDPNRVGDWRSSATILTTEVREEKSSDKSQYFGGKQRILAYEELFRVLLTLSPDLQQRLLTDPYLFLELMALGDARHKRRANGTERFDKNSKFSNLAEKLHAWIFADKSGGEITIGRLSSKAVEPIKIYSFINNHSGIRIESDMPIIKIPYPTALDKLLKKLRAIIPEEGVQDKIDQLERSHRVAPKSCKALFSH